MCNEYEFYLRNRTLTKKSRDTAAQKFFDECAGTPEKLMSYVERGNWDERILTCLLVDPAQVEYHKARDVAGVECCGACKAAEVEWINASNAAAVQWNNACGAAGAKYNNAYGAAAVQWNNACDAAFDAYSEDNSWDAPRGPVIPSVMKPYYACDAAREEHHKSCANAVAKQKKADVAARAEYDKACGAALAEYIKACIQNWLRIFANPKNRVKIWEK